MAINSSIFSGSQSKWGICEETAFGTVATPASAAFEMMEGPIPSVDQGLTRDFSVKNNGSRVRSVDNQYSTTTGGIRVISFSDLLVRRTDLCNLMVAVMQNVTEATTPFLKTFAWGPATTQPTFITTSGKCYSIGIVGPIASYMQEYKSCILRSLTLKPGADGRLTASGEWISGFAPVTTANFGGTWAYNTQNYYNTRALANKTFTASDVVVYDWSVTFNNHAVPLSWSSTGEAESYVLGSTDAGYEVTGSATLKYDAATQGILADSLAGTPRLFRLSMGTDVNTAGWLDMQFLTCLFDGVDKDYTMEVGQAVKFNFTCGNVTTGHIVDVFITDGVDQTWVDF